jgi:YHS domain-containing protein
MKFNILRKSIIILIILTPLITDQGCKKQPKCGCGKDVIFTLTDAQVLVQYTESSKTAVFYPTVNTGETYYFCNPGKWIDTLKTMNTQQYVLLSGKAYYDCTYLMNSGSYGYYVPPVYQVDVTSIKEDNYGKK